MPEFNPPFLFGHRGAPAQAPENSLTAFALAAQQGADGIELDVHLTADGHVVVLHDDTVNATTDGRGAIAAMTLEQARRLHLRPRGGPPSSLTGETIPLLAEVLARFANGALTINVEIKSSKTPDLVEATATVVRESRAENQVLISSFDRFVLAYLQQRHPALRRALLFPPSSLTGVMVNMRGTLAWITGAHALGCEAVHPFWRLASHAAVARAHDLGMDVNVWTVDDERTIRRLVALDVDGIITNDPARARAAIMQLATVQVG